MWYRWMLIAYFTNGLSAFGTRVLQDMGLAESHGYLYLNFWYLSGLLVALVILLATRQGLRLREVILGGLMGLFSAGFWVLLTAALGQGVPGYLAFPVAIGGSLSVVALIGVVVLRERLSAYGYAGVLLGISSLVVLVTA